MDCDLITGTDLAAAVRILSALPVARAASESAVHLAQGGTTLAGLLLVTVSRTKPPTQPASVAGSIRSMPLPQRLWCPECGRPPRCCGCPTPPRNR